MCLPGANNVTIPVGIPGVKTGKTSLGKDLRITLLSGNHTPADGNEDREEFPGPDL